MCYTIALVCGTSSLYLWTPLGCAIFSNLHASLSSAALRAEKVQWNANGRQILVCGREAASVGTFKWHCDCYLTVLRVGKASISTLWHTDIQSERISKLWHINMMHWNTRGNITIFSCLGAIIGETDIRSKMATKFLLGLDYCNSHDTHLWNLGTGKNHQTDHHNL